MTEREKFVRHLIDHVWRMEWKCCHPGFEVYIGNLCVVGLKEMNMAGRKELCLKVRKYGTDDMKVISVSDMPEIAGLYSLVDCAVNHREITDEPFFAYLNANLGKE